GSYVVFLSLFFFFFFFSSRRRHTRFSRDWSSDVCSSDLTSLSSNARIHSGNTVDTLIFMGSGVVRYGNNTIKHLSFAGDGVIGGASNVIQYAEVGGALETIDNGGHVFDTLYTAPNKNISIRGTITVNKHFRAGGAPCD